MGNGYQLFSLVKKFEGLLCGFTNNLLGYQSFSVAKKEDVFHDREILCKKLNIDLNQFVFGKQIHGNHVEWVSHVDRGKGAFEWETQVPETDALCTDEKGIFLGVVTADCVPIIIYDSVNQYCGCIHAGWKGTLNLILKKTIDSFIKKGSKIENLYISFGPAIRPCCYNVSGNKERLKIFKEKFGIGVVNDGYLDLIQANIEQIKEFDLRDSHIDTSVSYCTSCYKNNLFASHYRSTYLFPEKRETMVLTFIGLRDK